MRVIQVLLNCVMRVASKNHKGAYVFKVFSLLALYSSAILIHVYIYKIGETFHNTELLRLWICLFIIVTMIEVCIWDLFLLPLIVCFLIAIRLDKLFSSPLHRERPSINKITHGSENIVKKSQGSN